ncbi:hypothetical protein [Amycolatopsis sp. MtRt-6]|uniref:hypothetical protein n=1 Tax=Amycolatopsis sp. MtRt-6 TaxID=2792782 RepID=UPI001A9063EF|nr:hypothetical protein [Amycolatopsis sp. MtRt-6]
MDEVWYRVGMVVAFFLGVWEGPIAIIFRAFTHKGPSPLVAANYLPSPWCYAVAGVAAIAAFGAIALLETRRKQAEARQAGQEAEAG